MTKVARNSTSEALNLYRKGRCACYMGLIGFTSESRVAPRITPPRFRQYRVSSDKINQQVFPNYERPFRLSRRWLILQTDFINIRVGFTRITHYDRAWKDSLLLDMQNQTRQMRRYSV